MQQNSSQTRLEDVAYLVKPGMWVAKFDEPIKRAPNVSWVVPAEGATCNSSCATLGADWRDLNAGSNTTLLCAGLVNLPGLGPRWLGGWAPATKAVCYIECASKPCWNTPTADTGVVTAAPDEAWFMAGSAKDLGTAQTEVFPMKCTCAQCTGPACDTWMAASWRYGLSSPPSSWWDYLRNEACNAYKNVQGADLQAQQFSSSTTAVHSRMCRIDAPELFGLTGWVDGSLAGPGNKPVCRHAMFSPSEEFSVLCPHLSDAD